MTTMNTAQNVMQNRGGMLHHLENHIASLDAQIDALVKERTNATLQLEAVKERHAKLVLFAGSKIDNIIQPIAC